MKNEERYLKRNSVVYTDWLRHGCKIKEVIMLKHTVTYRGFARDL
jgi:hypothetical protein